MRKTNNTNAKPAAVQPQPAMQMAEGSAAKSDAKSDGPAKSDAEGDKPDNVAMLPGMGKRPNLFSEAATRISEAARDKVVIMGDAKQKLAEAYDLYKEGGDKQTEATAIAAEAAAKLYKGRTDGVISPDEVSAALGDVFGYKPKQDGTPGKTPAGQGEAIRKRVVRASQAWEYANDGDGGRFFTGLPRDQVGSLCNQMENGDISIYWLYDKLGELKREHMTRTNPAFDPKKIAAIVDALTEEGAIAIIVANPALQLAYGELMNVLAEVGEMAAAAKAEAKAA